MPLALGTRLGPYEVLAPLGAGGMGEVYRVRDARLGREVAIKVLLQHLPASPEDRARLRREAKTISSLNHPHICVLHDIGREGETDFLVMELVEGETLAQRLARGPLPTADVLMFGAQIADALDRAHRAGVVHRDLKPGNVMLTKGGAKLMDFGLARRASRAGHTRGGDVTVTTWARVGEGPQSVLSPILVRWLTAQAFERCQESDSAAAYYKLALDPTRLVWERRLDIKLISSSAHERLAKIYPDAVRN